MDKRRQCPYTQQPLTCTETKVCQGHDCIDRELRERIAKQEKTKVAR